MKIVSEGGAPVLKSEKKNEYKTSGRINMLLTVQFNRPFKAHTMGSAAIATKRILQTIQLFSKPENTEYKKYITEKISIPTQAVSKFKSFFLFWDV